MSLCKYCTTRTNKELFDILKKEESYESHTIKVNGKKIYVEYYLATPKWEQTTNGHAAVVFWGESITFNIYYSLKDSEEFWAYLTSGEANIVYKKGESGVGRDDMEIITTKDGREFSGWSVNYALSLFDSRGWVTDHELYDAIESSLIVQKIIQNEDWVMFMPAEDAPEIDVGIGRNE